MRSRRAILRKRLPSSNHLSSIRRKKKRIALGVSTTYTRIRQEKEESKNNRININVSQLPPLKPLSKEDIKSLSPSNTDGSIVLNRLVESPILAEDILVEDQISKDIQNLIQELPEDQKEVLIMRLYRDMSFKEISENTRVSINTALGRMRYAIINLRKLISEHKIVLEA